MIYSKYLRHAHCAMSHNLIKYKFSSTVKSNILHTTAKVSKLYVSCVPVF